MLIYAYRLKKYMNCKNYLFWQSSGEVYYCQAQKKMVCDFILTR